MKNFKMVSFETIINRTNNFGTYIINFNVFLIDSFIVSLIET